MDKEKDLGSVGREEERKVTELTAEGSDGAERMDGEAGGSGGLENSK